MVSKGPASPATHEQGEIELGDVHEHAPGVELVVAEVSASHAADFEGVSERPLDEVATQTYQGAPARSVIAAAVRVVDGLILPLLRESLPTALRLRRYTYTNLLVAGIAAPSCCGSSVWWS